ncbi:MAG: hypothetical protein J6D21_12640 [Clostridia bacterium]|nr:hypothetical protein [Clostridia bacterium]
MLLSEREKLFSRTEKTVSIGITEGGVPRTVVHVPWESTAHAFNMRTPNVYLSPEDVADGEILAKLCTFRVIGCYIWVPLSEYSFLSAYTGLEDLYIEQGWSITNLDFLTPLTSCRMLFLEGASLKNLDTILAMRRANPGIFSCFRCLALHACRVEDLSAFREDHPPFSELLLFSPKGEEDASRWNIVSARTKRFFEYEK